jgi:hypothetical protein
MTTIERITGDMRITAWLGVRLLALMLSLSMLAGCIAHNTGAGLATEIDKGALFSTTVQTLKWEDGTATLRRTQSGYDQVKMTGWGPVITLSRGLPDPRIERIDVVSGHPVLMVSTQGDASCPRTTWLVFRKGEEASAVKLRDACQVPQVSMRDGAMWGSDDHGRDQWKTDGLNIWRVRPPVPVVAPTPKSRPASGRRVAAKRAPASRSGPNASLTAPLARPSSQRLSHMERVSVTDTVELERSPEVGQPVHVDITGG